MKTYPMQLCITTQIQVFNNNTSRKKNMQCCRSAHDVVDDNPNSFNRLKTQLLHYCIVTKHQSICFSCSSSIVHAPFVSLSSHFLLQSSLHPYCRINIARLEHISNLNSRVKKRRQNVWDQKLNQNRTW